MYCIVCGVVFIFSHMFLSSSLQESSGALEHAFGKASDAITEGWIPGIKCWRCHYSPLNKVLETMVLSSICTGVALSPAFYASNMLFFVYLTYKHS